MMSCLSEQVTECRDVEAAKTERCILDGGRVVKVVNLADSDSGIIGSQGSIVVESVQVFGDGEPVRNLLIYEEPMGNRVDLETVEREAHLVVVSDHEVRRLPVQRCARAQSCEQCVRMRDPFCAWDLSAANCAPRVAA